MKSRKKSYRWFQNVKISDKIALMYGVVFMVLMFLISTFIIFNGVLSYLSVYKSELEDLNEYVIRHIEETGEISSRELNELINNDKIIIRVVEIPPDTVIRDDYPKQNRSFKGPMPAGVEGPGGLMSNYFTSFGVATYNHKRYGVVLERGRHLETKILKTSGIIIIIVNCISVLLATFAGKYMSKKILKPIVTITETAERIGVEDLSRRIEYQGPEDEIKQLADTFNEMIERLEVAFDKQTQFISDASHELRTPISVIQGYANLIDRWGKDNPDVLQESIDSIVSETDHMSMLIKKLLFLARNEHNKKLDLKKCICLNDIAFDVIKEINVLDKNYNMKLVEESEVYIKGDKDLIKQMIWIFLENSMKYSNGENQEIMIKVAAQNEKALISVIDHGIGISSEDLPRVFERFYRADKSRSKEIPGTGIGLSIADWIIKSHRGKVSIHSELGQGTEIIVQLPLDKNYDMI